MMETDGMEPIGLIPAAGQALRLQPLPCSKELLPVGWRSDRESRPRAQVVCHGLLEKLNQAGVRNVYVVLRPGKWDIPAYLGNGSELGLNLAYLVATQTFGVPYSLDRAQPFVRKARIFLGFPDLLFQPRDAYVHLNTAHDRHRADVTLGLFELERRADVSKVDLVDFLPDGKVRDILIKPAASDLAYSWIAAVWTPRFTQFMHEYVEHDRASRCADSAAPELHLGHVLQGALRTGLRVIAHPFPGQTFVDIGTPDALAHAWSTQR